MDAALNKIDLNSVMRCHAVLSVVIGTFLVILPHTLFGVISGEAYSHLAHEVVRCYGALTIAQGWMAYRTCYITDSRVRKLLSESYCICYGVSALCLFKAWFSSPSSHTLWSFTLVLLSSFACFFYGYFRFAKPIKSFELPGAKLEASLWKILNDLRKKKLKFSTYNMEKRERESSTLLNDIISRIDCTRSLSTHAQTGQLTMVWKTTLKVWAWLV